MRVADVAACSMPCKGRCCCARCGHEVAAAARAAAACAAGATGMRQSTDPAVERRVRQLHAWTATPVCVGFGVSGPEQAGALGCAGCRLMRARHGQEAGGVLAMACSPQPAQQPSSPAPVCCPNPSSTSHFTTSQASRIRGWGADGVICGSALVRALGEAGGAQEGLRRLADLARALRAAI